MHRRFQHALFAISAASLFVACAKVPTYSEDDGSDFDASGSGSASSSTAATSVTSVTSGGATTVSSTSAATSGAGGAASTATSGAGAAGGADPISTVTSTVSSTAASTSGGSAICAHDVCEIGGLLDYGCNSCVTSVCDEDPYCCDTEWDDICVGEVADFCDASAQCQALPTGLQPGDIIITEIMNDPVAVYDNKGEWFEVYNPTASPIDLDGLIIRHHYTDPTKVYTIDKTVIVPAGGYAVLGNNEDTATNGNVTVDYQYPTSIYLGNTADYLALETDAGMIIDHTEWDENSGLDPAGKSRSLDPGSMNASDNDNDTNFCEASSTIPGGTDLGTPGKANDTCM